MEEKIEKRKESGMTETEMESRDKVQIEKILFLKKVSKEMQV